MIWLEQIKTDIRQLASVGLSFFVVLGAGGVAHAFGGQYSQAVRFSQVGLLIGVILGPVFAPMVARWANTLEHDVPREDSELYLEGKMRRYSLLFSVNGGAFLIAKLIGDGKPTGGLSMFGLSVGAAVFTIIMTADIWLWGAGMREKHGAKLFRPVGQTILLMIGALLFSGWMLVGLYGA